MSQSNFDIGKVTVDKESQKLKNIEINGEPFNGAGQQYNYTIKVTDNRSYTVYFLSNNSPDETEGVLETNVGDLAYQTIDGGKYLVGYGNNLQVSSEDFISHELNY